MQQRLAVSSKFRSSSHFESIRPNREERKQVMMHGTFTWMSEWSEMVRSQVVALDNNPIEDTVTQTFAWHFLHH
jgi:hypothetical protein